MSDDLVRLHFQLIRQHLAILQKVTSENSEETELWGEVDAVLEDLHVIYEQMQTTLESTGAIQEGLLQQNQHITADFYHYRELFHSSPLACLVIDSNGVISDANYAIAQLLNLPQNYLLGKPLFLYLSAEERDNFYARFNDLTQSYGIQVCQMQMHPHNSEPVETEWHITIARSADGLVERLQIGVYTPHQTQQTITQFAGQRSLQEIRTTAETTLSQLPQSLDGLQVLVVDDEADICEFVKAVLGSYGIKVKAVRSSAAALEELKQFRPDVLLSDIRMPNEDGYSLIQQIRSLEGDNGARLPVGAITAYLDEDRDKVLKAGFEAHLHKLAQPSEWVEMVAQLAKRVAD